MRYISDETQVDGKSKELIYIENNYEHILEVIKSYNECNNIIYIGNDGVTSSKIDIYNVQKDDNDVVNRNPIHDNKELFELFNDVEFPNKQKNINKYLCKQKRKRCLYNRVKRNIVSKINKLVKKEYIHKNQC